MTVDGSFLNAVNTVFTLPLQGTGFNGPEDERQVEQFKERLEDANCLESIGCRGLFLLQAVASVVALFFIAIVGTLAAIVRSPWHGSKGFKEMYNALASQVLVGLAVPGYATFHSLSSTFEYHVNQMEKLEAACYDLTDAPEAPPAPPAEDGEVPPPVRLGLGGALLDASFVLVD